MRYLFIYCICLGLLVLVNRSPIQAQSIPQGISYQALARGAEGNPLVNAFIDVKLGIRSESINGPLSWVEEHGVSTDSYGLFHLVIGDGVSTGEGSSPSFEEISWADNSHFLSVWIDPGIGSYELMGTSQLLSVPYALVAGRALNTDDDDSDPVNELITNLSINGSILEILEANITHSVDLGDVLSDGDENPNNESLTLLQLQGNMLNIVESGQVHQLDLSAIADDEDWVKEDGKVYNINENIGIGTSEPSSTLHIQGSIAGTITVHNGPNEFNLSDQHHVLIANVNDQNLTVNLPDANLCEGRIYIIKKISNQAEGVPITNTLNLIASAGQSIDGSPNHLLNTFFRQEIGIISDGTNWWIIHRSSNE